MKLVCDCLNLKIHIKGELELLNPIQKKAVGIDMINDADAFFKLSLSLCQLDIEGIQEEYSCLVSHRTVDNWIVAQCLNCDVNTHAVNIRKGGNEILVNTNLQTSSTNIEQQKKSDEFSSLYKIVIHNRPDNLELPLRSEKYESAHVGLNQLQQKLNMFLISEETEMETRIREFNESEHAKYAELQNKARREKNTLIRIVLASGDSEFEMSSSLDESSSSPVSPRLEDQKVPLSKMMNQNQNSMVVKERKPIVPNTLLSMSPENEEMFMLDPFDNDSPMNFTESDDEENDLSDCDSSMSSSSSKDIPVRSLYSSSVPVNVPGWMNKDRRNMVDLEADDDMPNDIAASIRALAQSVREDGTEIFGDLPRKKTSRVQFTDVKVQKVK